jgi:hypothetical protein
MRPLNARFDANVRPIGESELFAEVSPQAGLVEGIAVDPHSVEFYVTGATERKLIAMLPHGGRALEVGAAGSLLGAVFDPRSRRLWVASAVIEETPRTGELFSGLLSVDPANPERASHIPGPEGAILGDVNVSRDGFVYASDGLNGGVYHCRPGCVGLETVLMRGRLFSAQGLAVSADQKWLYVADRRYGLAALERQTGHVFKVTGAPDMMLDGIDGLVAYEGDLIATQTAYAPQRIVRLRLSPDGLHVTRLDVLERANPEWGEVTLAAVAGDRLLYVAGAQWERFGPGGAVKGDAPLEPTPIRMLKLK